MPIRGEIVNPRKRGVYETWYGNAAVVSGPNAKTAKDLDSGERIPISEVTHKYLRPVERFTDTW